MKNVVRAIRLLPFALLLVTVLQLHAQQPAAAAPSPAPVPALLQTAKSVFISNAGMDADSAVAFRKIGMPNQPYNALYAAVAAWGHYQMATTPESADLVFQVRFDAPLQTTGKIDSYAPQYELTIFDPKSHVILWSFSEPIDGAFRKSTAVKNVAKGIDALMADLKALTAAPAQP